VRRRRECPQCDRRFTTFERRDPEPAYVIKRDGETQRFDRTKLRAALLAAAHKRPVTAVDVETIVPGRYRIATGLGPAILDSAHIPVALDPSAPRVVDHPLTVAGETVRVTATSLGNPHCAVFLDAPADDALLSRMGPLLERHPFFPRRTNVEFVSVPSRSELRVRFWERGVGYTRASGTGAASAAVAAIVRGVADRSLRVVCDGGTLEVEWPEGGDVRQVGEVEIVFEGEWLV